MAVRVIEGPGNFQQLLDSGKYDSVSQSLRNQIDAPDGGQMLAVSLKTAIDHANAILDEGMNSGLPDQRPWVMEALRCSQIVYQVLGAISANAGLRTQCLESFYNNHLLLNRIQLSPAYQAWEEECRQILLSAKAPSIPEIPATFTSETGRLEFSQNSICVKMAFTPKGESICAPSDGRRGGAPRGDQHIFYFVGKLEELSLEQRIEIFDLLQQFAESKNLWVLTPYYLQDYRKQTALRESDSVENFIQMLQFMRRR